MALLLVDDRDGRIVAQIETQEQVRQVLEGWAREDRGFPDYLCLVDIEAWHGSLLGTETSVKVRPLLP